MTLRRTPFHSCHVEAGARMVPFAGFEMPVQYTGLAEEHRAVREAAGLFDVSHMGEVRVRGARAEEALQHLLSNGILRLKPGHAQYNMMCNDRGGVVDDVFVYRLAEDDFLVCVNAANRAKDFAWFCARNPLPDDVTIEDEGDAWAQLAIQGPAGVGLVDSLTSVDARSVGRRQFIWGDFAGVAGCLIARTGYTGEDGFEVFIPADHCEGVWDAVMQAGASVGLRAAGLGARDTLRLEAGNCLYGHELSDDWSPLQAGLGWVVKVRKPGGFIGRDAIVSRTDLSERKLVGLRSLGKRIPREGMSVRLAEAVVGVVTSGTRGPSVGYGISMAYVEAEHGVPGTQLDVDVRGRIASVEVVSLPFYRRPE